MLSDAVASVKRLVNTGVAYRAAHKHHKCNNCGLYGHIAADCMHICAECGGKHLTDSCIISIGNQLKTLVDSLCHDFVKDYNRVRKAYLSITNKPVVYTHVIPDSCCRLELEPSGQVKPTVIRSHQVKAATFNFDELWDMQGFFSKLSNKKPTTCESAMRWAEPFISQRKAELISEVNFDQPKLVNQVSVGSHIGCDIEPISFLKSRFDGNQAPMTSAKWYLRVKYKFFQDLFVKDLPVCTIMTGHHINFDQTNKNKPKTLLSKMKSYQALSKNFDEIMQAQKKLVNLSHNKAELVHQIDELTQKVLELKSKYNSKKINMIEGLRTQATHIINKTKNIAKAKVKKLSNKIQKLQEKADAIYENRQEQYNKRERIRMMNGHERMQYYQKACVDAGVLYYNGSYQVVCHSCHHPVPIRLSDVEFLDSRGVLCEHCKNYTFISDDQRVSWSQL